MNKFSQRLTFTVEQKSILLKQGLASYFLNLAPPLECGGLHFAEELGAVHLTVHSGVAI